MSKIGRDQRGATMLEFALVSSLFFGAIFSIFEIARFLSINALVSSATQIASNYTRKISCIDEDLRACVDTTCLGYRRIVDARSRVQNLVRNVTASSLGYGAAGAPTRSSTNLSRYRNIDFLNNWTLRVDAPDSNILDVLVLRPGDAAIDLQETDPNKQIICHPVIRPPITAAITCSNPVGSPYLPTYRWRDIIQSESIIVSVDSDYKSLFPIESLFSLAMNLIVTDAHAAPPTTPVMPKALKKSQKGRLPAPVSIKMSPDMGRVVNTIAVPIGTPVPCPGGEMDGCVPNRCCAANARLPGTGCCAAMTGCTNTCPAGETRDDSGPYPDCPCNPNSCSACSNPNYRQDPSSCACYCPSCPNSTDTLDPVTCSCTPVGCTACANPTDTQDPVTCVCTPAPPACTPCTNITDDQDPVTCACTPATCPPPDPCDSRFKKQDPAPGCGCTQFACDPDTDPCTDPFETRNSYPDCDGCTQVSCDPATSSCDDRYQSQKAAPNCTECDQFACNPDENFCQDGKDGNAGWEQWDNDFGGKGCGCTQIACDPATKDLCQDWESWDNDYPNSCGCTQIACHPDTKNACKDWESWDNDFGGKGCGCTQIACDPDTKNACDESWQSWDNDYPNSCGCTPTACDPNNNPCKKDGTQDRGAFPNNCNTCTDKTCSYCTRNTKYPSESYPDCECPCASDAEYQCQMRGGVLQDDCRCM